MKFYCDGCATDRDFDLDYSLLIITEREGLKRFCRYCRKPKSGLPDVFFDGKPEENLADDPATGKPRVFSSKAEKAAYLKEHNLVEAGDRVHGAPVSLATRAQPQTRSRDEVRRALLQVKQMSVDRRRQEYLRIMKGRDRHA